MSIKPQRDLLALRSEIIATCRRLDAIGLNQGTSGNVSVRIAGDRFLVTPTGIPYDVMTEDEIAEVTFDGAYHGPRRPSSEWRFHRDILARRPDVDTVIHTHAMFSTTIACQRLEIPAFHYMIAAAGGNSIRCADYATFGSQELADNVLKALEGRRACLLANHGVIATGRGLAAALGLLVEVETLAAQYWRVLQLGKPIVLDDVEMAKVVELFKTYGKQDAPDGELRHGESLSARA